MEQKPESGENIIRRNAEEREAAIESVRSGIQALDRVVATEKALEQRSRVDGASAGEKSRATKLEDIASEIRYQISEFERAARSEENAEIFKDMKH